ncbi:MAG: N-acyl homoserine lactonase family protein [Proteobacteria bacterium]|nr:N-acyl homoserine lactonase family protein [Pseudomonadota bacterium]
MTRPDRTALAAFAALALASCAPAPTAPVAERIYAMDCGQNIALDQSRWSPGVAVGQPLTLANNCYLIRHARGLLLWDTGYPDALVGNPVTNAVGTASRARTLASQLAEIGVKPDDIKYVGISHTHGDHVGNVALFAKSEVLIQRAEYDWAFGPGRTAPFPASANARKLDGDLDVFGDGSIVMFTTPGHTPGHQSLRVRLAKTGTLVLSGDATHFTDNWANRRVPVQNFDKDQTLASMQRIAATLAAEKAELWINHDRPQSLAQRRSPAFYD